MMRQAGAVSLVLLFLWSTSQGGQADTIGDIDHLLGFIGSSDCTFVRNGDEYDAAGARSHIERKYDYAKRWIKTAEQFIEYTATESSVSGKPYLVICAGREESSAAWLLKELTGFRAQQ